VADDLSQSHHSHLFGADDALQTRGRHALTAHAEEAGRLPAALSRFLSAAISSAP